MAVVSGMGVLTMTSLTSATYVVLTRNMAISKAVGSATVSGSVGVLAASVDVCRATICLGDLV